MTPSSTPSNSVSLPTRKSEANRLERWLKLIYRLMQDLKPEMVDTIHFQVLHACFLRLLKDEIPNLYGKVSIPITVDYENDRVDYDPIPIKNLGDFSLLHEEPDWKKLCSETKAEDIFHFLKFRLSAFTQAGVKMYFLFQNIKQTADAMLNAFIQLQEFFEDHPEYKSASLQTVADYFPEIWKQIQILFPSVMIHAGPAKTKTSRALEPSEEAEPSEELLQPQLVVASPQTADLLETAWDNPVLSAEAEEQLKQVVSFLRRLRHKVRDSLRPRSPTPAGPAPGSTSASASETSGAPGSAGDPERVEDPTAPNQDECEDPEAQERQQRLQMMPQINGLLRLYIARYILDWKEVRRHFCPENSRLV